MDDPNELAKDIITGSISGSVGKVVDSKVAVSLLGPAATELGDLMGQIASVAHFYATDNMARIFKRWAEQRDGKPISEPEFQKALPLLPAASLVSDEDLQVRWARLLESFAVGNPEVLPSFGHTLSQLTAWEAQFLEFIWNYNISGQRTQFHEGYKRFVHGDDLGKLADRHWQISQRETEEFEVTFSDLMRLGVLEANLEKRRIALGGKNTGGEEEGAYHDYFSLSGYGRRFMRVVRDSSVECVGDQDETTGELVWRPVPKKK